MSGIDLDVLSKQITDRIVGGLNEFSNSRARTAQGRAGYIGPSDLGFCRQKALLTIQGAERGTVLTTGFQEDDQDYVVTWPADVGSAVHAWIDDAFDGADDVMLGRDIGRVTATFPRTKVIVEGTPDLVIPGLNALIDVKSVNRILPKRREGVTQNNRFQRHTYAMGLIDMGLLRDDGSLIVGNLFFDRSGKDRRPWLDLELFDPTLTDQIEQWIEDVLYANTYSEEASRDIPASLCPYVCEFFDACRGGIMEDTHNPGLITDPDVLQAVALYEEGKRLKSEGDGMQKVAKPILEGVSGLARLGEEEFQVRWTHVNATEFRRGAHEKIDVRKIRRKS